MFRAIGTLLLIWGVVHIFSSASIAFEEALVAVFGVVEVVAIDAQQ
jgi:hypothetical protein